MVSSKLHPTAPALSATIAALSAAPVAAQNRKFAINPPDGSWSCDDDSASGFNARLAFGGETAESHDIYVGAFGRGAVSTTLNVSDIGFDQQTAPGAPRHPLFPVRRNRVG